jgi:hypothetical protein
MQTKLQPISPAPTTREEQPAARRRWEPPTMTRLSIVDTTLSKGGFGLDPEVEGPS